MNQKDKLAVIFLVGFSSLFIFRGLGSSALIDWDESIYASVSKEILENGDWLTLRWNKEVWFEKPPLYFWLTALTYSVFGVTEFAARFWSAIMGVVGVTTVYFFGKELSGRLAGFASAMILASTAHWLLQSRNGTLDIMAASFIALTLYFFWRARENPRFWKFTGLFLGLTFMTKSAVAVIPLLVMGVFGLLEVFYDRNFNKYPLKGFLHFAFCILLLVLPWHLAMYLTHGRAFIDEYFFYHILSRTKGIEGHTKPWFWYFVVFQHWARYWYLAFLGAVYLLAGFFVRDGIKKHLRGFFLFLWFFVAFLVFSVSQSKIEWYLVPLYPAVAILVGSFIPRRRVLVPFLVVFCLITAWRSSYLWKVEDYNRSIAETAKVMRQVSNLGDELLVANIAQGPPIFYSGRKVITIDWWGLRKKVLDGGRMFILTPEELFRNLEGEGLTSGVEIFQIGSGVALYGWK